MVSNSSAGNNHGQGDHPRNGYSEVRALFKLQEEIPIPSGTTFDVTAILADPYAFPNILPGPETDESQALPPSPIWRRSVTRLRLVKRPTIAGDHNHLDAEDVAVAASLWGLSSTAQRQIKKRLRSSDPSPAIRHYAEIVARWSVTVGCTACRDMAIERTMHSATQAIAALADGLTYAIPFPYAPLASHAFRDSQFASVKEFDLQDKLQEDHGVFITSESDPRIELAANLPSLHVQASHFELLTTILNAQNKNLEISSFYRFMAAAYRALYLESKPSSCILLAAQACESLFDLVLLHLLWWDRELPADAGQLLSDGVVKRVQSHYTRMGGTWDLATAPVLMAWRKAVADKRNRVAHGGQQATAAEAVEALTAARNVYDYFTHVANQEAARSRYPTLSGILDLRVMNFGTRKQREALSSYLSDEKRAHWSFRFYRALANRERWKANGNPMQPSKDQAQLWGTFHATSSDIEWWLYDSETHFVIQVERPQFDPAIFGELAATYRRKIRAGLEQDS
ncbi:hypothetical protein ACSNN9_23360, partial [Micromonospora sp. URMC 107]|uniref:hypothetical protein n=1 Tax=Micromonospora sp. URMC 107 TaxID=3423418 RepID=UPI003F1A99B5